MNKIIHIQLKYILLFIGVFLLVVYFSFSKSKLPEDKVETTTKTTVSIEKKVDSASVDVSKYVSKEKVAFLLDSVSKTIRKKTEQSQPKKPTEKEVKAYVYKDTTKLKNATVVSTITTPCRIFDFSLKAFTEEKTIATETQTSITKYRVPNVWFINYEPKFLLFPAPALIGHEVSVDYTIKNKFRLGAGVEFNTLLPKNNQFMFNFKIGIPL